jgi:hypothetical protein
MTSRSSATVPDVRVVRCPSCHGAGFVEQLIPLEEAEGAFDAAMRNPDLSADERYAAAERFFYRAYQNSADAARCLAGWATRVTS